MFSAFSALRVFFPKEADFGEILRFFCVLCGIRRFKFPFSVHHDRMRRRNIHKKRRDGKSLFASFLLFSEKSRHALWQYIRLRWRIKSWPSPDSEGNFFSLFSIFYSFCSLSLRARDLSGRRRKPPPESLFATDFRERFPVQVFLASAFCRNVLLVTIKRSCVPSPMSPASS